jgi:hypothetical protein
MRVVLFTDFGSGLNQPEKAASSSVVVAARNVV